MLNNQQIQFSMDDLTRVVGELFLKLEYALREVDRLNNELKSMEAVNAQRRDPPDLKNIKEVQK